MSNKTVSGYLNFLQKLALSVSDGAAEVKIHYVPVSHTPTVRVSMKGGFDAMDAVRDCMVDAVKDREFKAQNGYVFIRDSAQNGFIHIDIEEIGYDPVVKTATFECSVWGPYSVEQAGLPRKRDRAQARKAFEAAVRSAEDDARMRYRGAESIVRSMLMSLPGRAGTENIELLRDIDRTCDISALRRIAVAIAKGEASRAELEAAAGGEALSESPKP